MDKEEEAGAEDRWEQVAFRFTQSGGPLLGDAEGERQT